MNIHLTKIGNSKGIIIPAHLLKQCGFEGEVSLEVKDNALIISHIKHPREGWAEAFLANSEPPQDSLIDNTPNAFDEEEWVW